MAQIEIKKNTLIRPNSMPSLPELLPSPANITLGRMGDPKMGIVDWVEEGSACAVNPNHRFRPYRRRHHCRACGLLVCSACSRSARRLPGFGFPIDEPQRLCDACAARSHIELKVLANFWQMVANKNASASNLANSMSAVHSAGFRFAKGIALNWERVCQRLLELLQLEVGVVQFQLEQLGSDSDLTAVQIDSLALRRAHRLMQTLKTCSRDAPVLVTQAFRETFNRVVALREHCQRREAIAFHHNRMMALLNTPFLVLLTKDVVDVWGCYQVWADANRLAVSSALEGRIRELLNRVVKRDQSAANTELQLALNSKNITEIRKAVATCDVIMGALADSPYYEHIMPEIHVVIPGFSAHRRNAMKLIIGAKHKQHLYHQLRRTSLYPPKRI